MDSHGHKTRSKNLSLMRAKLKKLAFMTAVFSFVVSGMAFVSHISQLYTENSSNYQSDAEATAQIIPINHAESAVLTRMELRRGSRAVGKQNPSMDNPLRSISLLRLDLSFRQSLLHGSLNQFSFQDILQAALPVRAGPYG